MKKSRGVVIGLVLALAGCMGSARPDWVPKETPAFLKEQAFYGVGSASGVRNKILAKMTSEGRARSEVEHLLDAYAVALMEAYKTALPQDDLTAIEETQNLAFTFRTYVVTAISDAEIEHSWTDPDNGTHHSLAKLKLKRFTDRIRDAEEASPALRQFVKENAETTFDRLAAENEKKSE